MNDQQRLEYVIKRLEEYAKDVYRFGPEHGPSETSLLDMADDLRIILAFMRYDSND